MGTCKYLNWRYIVRNAMLNSIGSDFSIIENPMLDDIPQSPFKVDVTTVVLCREGTLEGNINLRPFRACGPCMVVLLADRILELVSVSKSFSGQVLVMSKKFTDNLLTDAVDRFPLTISTERQPCIPLTHEAYSGIENFFSMMNRAAAMTDNPDRSMVARHLMLAFMYGTRSYFHPDGSKDMSNRELLVERFLDVVKKEYRRERQLKCYADKLCMSPKYLSKIIKSVTGKSANEWINDHVMLNAKMMLKSTDMTVQQISNELNFENPSFFAKFFKRHVGISPKQYRKMHSDSERNASDGEEA